MNYLNRKRNEIQKVLKGRKYEFIFDISAYAKDDVEILLSSTCNSILKKYVFCSSGAVYIPTISLEKGLKQIYKCT